MILKRTLSLLLTAAPLMCAQALTSDLNPSDTKIRFTLGAALHAVHGTFQLRRGRVQFDPATRMISGEILVDATSGNSNGMRDRRMHEILESQRYPNIRFVPEKLGGTISPANLSPLLVTGLFEIHGASHELTIPVDVQIIGDKFTAQGKFLVPYIDWGMKDPSTFILRVEKKVTIEFFASGRVAAASEAP